VVTILEWIVISVAGDCARARAGFCRNCGAYRGGAARPAWTCRHSAVRVAFVGGRWAGVSC